MIGTTLGNRYEVLQKIGEGGMAIVYRAKDNLLNRNVAVKVLKEQFSNDAEFVEKFKREATAAASLSNNNIVNIYDVGSQQDVNYIVMEYVNGKTLKQVIKEKTRIVPSEAVEISIQIAKALECAHKNNIIHRDIKPHNILVTEDGIVKVTDFGIAKASNSVTITNSNRIMGSAHYFSPEQAKGSFVDFRTDIYSLGIVIYEMVTGRVPYDAESPVSVALKHIQEPVVPPKEIDGSIPDSLNKLILKAVEKEPIRRYQTMTDMLLDLKKIQNNENPNIENDDFDEDMTRVMDPADVNNALEANKDNENKSSKVKDDYGEGESKENKKLLDPKKKRNILFAALFLMVIVIGSTLGYFAHNKFFNSLGETTVPNVVGMKQDDAKSAIEAKKLKFVVVLKEKSDKAEGTVIETMPQAGTKVKINSEVRVSISGGKDKLTVPNVRGIDLSTAKDIITGSGLTVGNITYENSDSISDGQVISQDPDPDSNADKGTAVNLVVSKGPQVKYVSVPDVTGKSVDSAQSILQNAGFRVSTSAQQTSDSSQNGIVISQSPSQAKEGGTVNITYYKYVQSSNNPSQNNQNGNSNDGGNSKQQQNPTNNQGKNGDSTQGNNGEQKDTNSDQTTKTDGK